jgi:hypothetical protein
MRIIRLKGDQREIFAGLDEVCRKYGKDHFQIISMKRAKRLLGRYTGNEPIIFKIKVIK